MKQNTLKIAEKRLQEKATGGNEEEARSRLELLSSYRVVRVKVRVMLRESGLRLRLVEVDAVEKTCRCG